jgi:hypothetical protein
VRPVEDGEACRLVPARRGLARAARLGLPLSEGARLAHTPPLHAREAQRVRRGAAQAAEAAQPVDLARVRVGGRVGLRFSGVRVGAGVGGLGVGLGLGLAA